MIKRTITRGKFQRMWDSSKFDQCKAVYNDETHKYIHYVLRSSKNGHWMYMKVLDVYAGDETFFKVKIDSLV